MLFNKFVSDCVTGNKRLQDMMEVMAQERGAKLFATDER